jgi:hypothetical protein
MIRESFNRHWFVSKAGASASAAIGPITVPYDAMLFEERDPDTKNGGNTGFFPGGVYRYTKQFDAPEEWRDQTVIVEFEGVYERSEVSVNGHRVGGRPSGYALFHVPIHEHLVIGGANTIEVIADNSHMPNSRWYSGSGIYRPVNLLLGGPVRVAPTGLRISTTSIEEGTADLNVRTTITNDRADAVVAQVEARVGEIAVTTTLTLAPQSTDTVSQTLSVPDATLWSPDSPHLSIADVTLTIDGEIVDTDTEQFGIRIVTVDARNGLQINDTTVKLRGAAIHHDNGVIGAHTLDAAEDRRIRLLKKSGYNAIRSAHNPASRALLRACDRHGVLVMDELTDAWFRSKSAHDYSEIFEEWWERDLVALVANSFNHPSVIMYSIGNEISETATERGIAMNRTIANRTRELDPTRLVTNGINGFLNLIAPQDDEKLAKKAEAAKDKDEAPNKNLIRVLNAIIGILDLMLDRIVRLKAVDKRTRDAYADLDVAGYNYMVGRYELDGRLHPDRVIVGSETRAALGASIWKTVERLPHVIGDFTWTGWDYIGEAGIAAKEYGTTKRSIYHPYPALLAGEPVIDITGFRQSQSYLNEIAWHLSRGPHLAVEPVNHSGEKSVKTGWRATNSVPSWSWEGCEGRQAVVEVYADATRVELLLNGTRIGTKRATVDDGYLAKFTLAYQPGELVAVAYDADGTEIGRDVLVTAGDSLHLRVVPETDHLVADGADLAYLPIELTDANGVIRPLADRQVTIAVSGDATLLGFGSAEAITSEAFNKPSHSTYYGRAQAVIRAGLEPGQVTVTVSAADCETVTVFLPVTAASTAVVINK